MFQRSRNIIAVSIIFLILDALAVLTVCFSDIGKSAAIFSLIVCTIVAVPFAFAILWQSIYICRLKKFLDGLHEKPEHYFRKSSYQMKDRFYWFSDYFFDLRKLRKIPYEKIRSITVETASVGLGSIQFGIMHRSLFPIAGCYIIKVRYGLKSTSITAGDSERLCRSIIKRFTKKNENINVYNEP